MLSQKMERHCGLQSAAVLLKMQIATLVPKAQHLRQSPLIWGVVFVS